MAIHDLLQHEFLNAKQMRKLFGCIGVNTINDWVKTGKLPQPVSFGGHKLWPVEALKKFIKQRCLDHGYTETEVADIFSRARLAPPGNHIEVRVPVDRPFSEQKGGATR